AIGRVHGAEEARRALEAACAIFPRVNADLMYALPEQTGEHALADVPEATALGASHLSAYHLTPEPGTHFHRIPHRRHDAPAAAAFEFMLNAVRLVHASETARFARRPGLALAAIEQPLAAAEAQGLLERDHAMVRPTTKGQRFLNDLLALFLPANAAPRRTIPI